MALLDSIGNTLGTIKDNANRNAKKGSPDLPAVPGGGLDQDDSEPLIKAPQYLDRSTSGLGQIPSYDAGTDNVPDDQIAQLHKGEAVVKAEDNPNNPDNTLPRMKYDRPVSQGEQQEAQNRQLIEDHRANADEMMDAGAKKGSLAQVGTGVVLHNTIDRAEDRMTPIAPLTPSPNTSALPVVSRTMPRVGDVTPSAPAEGLPRMQNVNTPAPDQLIQTKPEMPTYIGQQRVGKGTPGEKQLIEDRQTKIDELKHTMTYGNREEAANAEEQLARLEKGTPWGSPENHPGLGGKIAHILGRVGQAGLAMTAPEALPLIPGSQVDLAHKEQQGIGKIKELGQEELTKAETDKDLAAAKASGTDAKTAAALLSKGYIAHTDPQGNVTLQQVPGFRDTPKTMQEQLSAATEDAVSRGVHPADDPRVQDVLAVIRSSEKPAAEPTNAEILAAGGTVKQVNGKWMQGGKEYPTQDAAERALGKAIETNKIAQAKAMSTQVNIPQATAEAQARNTIAHFNEPVAAFNPRTGKYEVMDRGEVSKGQFSYKIDPTLVNANAGRMDDVQNKINNLAMVVDSINMKDVNQALVGAALDKGTQLNFEGLHVDTGRLNAVLSAEAIASMNEPTRNYIVALLGAHEAVTNVPGLQTFGKSNRMTEKQMEAAQKMLPEAGDDANMARKKMIAFQGVLEPLRNRIITLPGQPLLPSFTEDMHNTESTTKGSATKGTVNEDLLKKHGGQ